MASDDIANAVLRYFLETGPAYWQGRRGLSFVPKLQVDNNKTSNSERLNLIFNVDTVMRRIAPKSRTVAIRRCPKRALSLRLFWEF